MYGGIDPQQDLKEVLRGQEELRDTARRESQGRRISRSLRKRLPATFKYRR